jgi:signal transduction histidine kinase
MLVRFLSWRLWLIIAFLAIAVGTIWFTNSVSRRIAQEEKRKVELWITAINNAAIADSVAMILNSQVIQSNTEIPIILTDERDSILESKNLDSAAIQADANYLKIQLKEIKNQNAVPIKIPIDSIAYNQAYYGHSQTFKQIKYFPLVQILVIFLFLVTLLAGMYTQFKSNQNQLWAGMAKETAHQLGTPVGSLQGWLELAKLDEKQVASYLPEMQKDVDRLKLVSERFGKIGSTPALVEVALAKQLEQNIDYMRKRASENVKFSLHYTAADITALINPELIDWVIENLLRNALDAIEGKGEIKTHLSLHKNKILITIADTGKGIEKRNFTKVFKAGYSTKKRGWGLGLALCKRIIENYHQGKIYVQESTLGKGTSFAIELNKSNA